MNQLKYIFIFLLALGFGYHAKAQQQNPYGMQSLKPKPPEPETKAPSVEEDVPPKPESEPAYKPMLPLTPKESLFKVDDLEKWTHLDEAALSHNDKDIKNLIHIIESDRGAVPPQGLFLAAKSLADSNFMEQAAVYYFVGQLRLAFDMQRWPSVQNKDDLEKNEEDSKKIQDQVAPHHDAPPRIHNPHIGIQNLSNGIGQPIIAWILKDPQRMDKVLNQVRIWDAASPYAYLPDYDLSDPIAFDKWEKTLKKVREIYFERMTNLMKAMERVKN